MEGFYFFTKGGEMSEDRKTYKISFKCKNCSHIYEKELQRGTTAQGHAGPCPNCGCSENTVDATGQKLGRFEVIPATKDLEKVKKVELLLEKKHERS